MSPSGMPHDFKPFPAAGVDVEAAVALGGIFAGPDTDRQVWMRPEDYRFARVDSMVRRNIDLQKRACAGCGQ